MGGSDDADHGRLPLWSSEVFHRCRASLQAERGRRPSIGYKLTVSQNEPLRITGVRVTDWHKLESFSFGDSPALADELAALVLAGTKTATCSAASDGASTHVGKQMVVLSGSGRPLAVIETVELTHAGSTT